MKRKTASLLSLLLALTFIAGAFVALPASAKSSVNIDWSIDFGKMSNITDNGGNKEFSLQVNKDATICEFDGSTCLGVDESNYHYLIVDQNVILPKVETFFVNFDVYFDEFPHGSTDNAGVHYNNPSEYPVAFFTWITLNGSTKNWNRSLRIDENGWLYTSSNPNSRTPFKFDADRWYNVTFAISPATGTCEIYLDGELSYTVKFQAVPDGSIDGSQLRFFDTRYQYTTYLKNIHVYSDNEYQTEFKQIASKEPSSDFVAYQTTKPVDGKFDIRFVSALNSLDYNKVGYEVISMKGGEKSDRVETSYVSESLIADGKKVTADKYKAKYFATYIVEDVGVSDIAEFIIRPYIEKNGLRVYGTSTTLEYNGNTKNGYPVLDAKSQTAKVDIKPSEDTYTQVGKTDVKGADVQLAVKNCGVGVSNDRAIYLKFAISEDDRAFLEAAGTIEIKLYVQGGRGLVGNETQEGGILANIYGIDTEWSEKTLTYSNSSKFRGKENLAGSFRYMTSSKAYFAVDVTEYVHEMLSYGADELAFRMENVDVYRDSGEILICSKEGANPPLLHAESNTFNHVTNLEKTVNLGYEPWGYAEKLVDEWFNTDKAKLYEKTYDSAPITSSYKGAAMQEFTVPLDWSSCPTDWETTPTSVSHYYIRTLDTLIEKAGYQEVKATYDEYGGVTNAGVKGNATGYFHMETIGGRPYIIDPLGNPFFSMGVNTVQLGSTDGQKNRALAVYGSEAAFFSEISARLMETGINAAYGVSTDKLTTTSTPIGGVMTVGMVSTYMNGLGLGVSTGGSQAFANNNTMNVFDPDFVTSCYTKAKNACTPLVGNKHFIGYVGDNELPYQASMLYDYLTLDTSVLVNAFSYATAWTWLARATGKINPSLGDITPALSEEFKCFIFNRYFKTVHDAILSVDNNHMLMGDRMCSTNCTSEGHLRAAGYYCDVLTCNYYRGPAPETNTAATIWKYTGKPFIVTEFFAIAEDTTDGNGYALANTCGAGWKVRTQQDRANSFESYALVMLESGYCVGLTWYRFRDNDQSLYKDANGTIYRPYRQNGNDVSSLIDSNGKVVSASSVPVVRSYIGESDSTNFSSNKGLFDNDMGEYTTLTASFKRISDNVFGLMDFFAKKK